MAAKKKTKSQIPKLDKAAVQRVLDLARILREVTSVEDIERLKAKIQREAKESSKRGRKCLT